MIRNKATTDFPHDDYRMSMSHRLIQQLTLPGVVKILQTVWTTGFPGIYKSIRFHIRLTIARYLNERYDKKFHVNTWQTIPIGELDINSDNSAEAYDYAPTTEKSFKHILSNINIDFSNYTYVDFGSGQGKTLLLASEYCFKKIIGVEFARDLHLTAEPNIKSYRSSTQR